jgi:hypothetical protein
VFWCGYLGERDYSEGVGIDELIILKWIFKERDEVTWIGFI